MPIHSMRLTESVRRKLLQSLLAVSLGVLAACGGEGDDSPSATVQVATWTASQSDLNEDLSALGIAKPNPAAFQNQTFRQIARIAVGGTNIRVKFSNKYGATPLTLDKVRIAKSIGAAAIDVSSDQPVTFSGATALTLAAGQELWSDPIKLSVDAHAQLAVSIFTQQATIATAHRFSNTSTYVATGDQTSASTLSAAASSTSSSSYFMSEIDVERTAPTKVIVAFGDSITDGNASTTNAYLDYPDQLANRALAKDPNLSVVNAGLGGNRWLNDVFGTKGVERFASDALGVSGVSDVIILLGVNDLGFSLLYPDQVVTSDQVIAAATTVIAQAKAMNVRVFMGTITPFKGAFYYTDAGEAKRQAINAWIRTNKDIAGVVDFDKAMQDPSDPLSLPAAWQSGDHLHPNDAGYGQMAATVDLSAL